VDAAATRPGDLGEIARLLETFNQATEKLAGSYRRIEELQTELARKDREIARKSRLETLGRMASTLAHEIRNPLGGIQLYAGLLRRDLEGDPDKARALDRILGAVAGLDKLVEDMLVYGRELELRRSRRSLGDVVEDALALARVSLDVRREGAPGEADVDADALGRAFLNLILNASQAAKSAITIRYEGTSVSIEDDGPGLPPELIDKLFTPFTTSKAKGTGLGLAIAHKIVEAHGGTIEARNAPGGGALFTVRM
jgi:signal transduction histidine kinase